MPPLRSIHFFAELVTPPAVHALERLHQIHHRTFQDPAVRYANFQVLQNGAALSNPVSVAGAISSVTILSDRVRVQEQSTGIAPEDFAERLERIAALVTEELGVPAFPAQQFLVQSLVNPRSEAPALEFLGSNVLGWNHGELDALPGTPDLLGVRLRLPPSTEGDATFVLRVENYERDRQSLFVESAGLFRAMVTPERVRQVALRFDRTYRLLEGPLMEFVARFEGCRGGE